MYRQTRLKTTFFPKGVAMASSDIVCQFDFRSAILATSLVVSNAITIFLYLKNRTFAFNTLLGERLFKIQNISFDNPFLEDKKFIEGWDMFCHKYRNNEITDYDNQDTKRYMQYEQYCEMIFNLISDTYEATKSEERLLERIAFKSWARDHKNWWKNPLDQYSNHDSYSKDVCDMVNSWVN